MRFITAEALERETLSTMEAAHVLKLSPRRVHQISDAGKLATYRTPIGRLYPVADVERLAVERGLAAA